MARDQHQALPMNCLQHTVRCVFQCVVWASRQDDDELWSVKLRPEDPEPCCRSQRCVFQSLVLVIRSQPCMRLQSSPPDNISNICLVLPLHTHCDISTRYTDFSNKHFIFGIVASTFELISGQTWQATSMWWKYLVTYIQLSQSTICKEILAIFQKEIERDGEIETDKAAILTRQCEYNALCSCCYTVCTLQQSVYCIDQCL